MLRALLFTVALLVSALASPAHAVNLIRDAEIEATLRFIGDPILRAAGLNPGRARIIIVNDPEMNAFVTGGQNIFINSGMLLRLETVPMIQAVIAHEAAHIASGHIISLNSNDRLGNTAAVGAVLAGMAALSGRGDAATAIAAGSAQVAARTRLAHSRAAEASADQGSVRYLARAGVDPQAALDTLRLFRGQEVLSSRHIDPYALTHPMTSQRITLLEAAVRGAKVSNVKPHPNLDYWHARMVAKFQGFTTNPRRSLKRLPKGYDNEITVYRRAIANQRMSNLGAAQKDIDWLIQRRPNDPYYHELRGQFLLDAGHATHAVSAYRAAAKLSKNNELILAGLGRALLAVNTATSNREALSVLRKAAQTGFPDGALYQNLAMAYARNGQNGNASLAVAEGYALRGRLADAAVHARRATGLLPQGTPGWRRANDILTAASNAARK